jgi:carbonic anhydrase/acetyltransferase-like protein (isoleucine patch superfamily)
VWHRYRRLVPIYALGHDEPDIHPDAFVHPDAVVIGAVRIGAQSSVLHTTPEYPTVVGDDCVIGHIVHLEGCTIGPGALIGSGAVVLHGVVVHPGAIVGANAVLLDGTEVPPGALAVGAPARIKPGVAKAESIMHGREVYVEKARVYRDGLRRIG